MADTTHRLTKRQRHSHCNRGNEMTKAVLFFIALLILAFTVPGTM